MSHRMQCCSSIRHNIVLVLYILNPHIKNRPYWTCLGSWSIPIKCTLINATFLDSRWLWTSVHSLPWLPLNPDSSPWPPWIYLFITHMWTYCTLAWQNPWVDSCSHEYVGALAWKGKILHFTIIFSFDLSQLSIFEISQLKKPTLVPPKPGNPGQCCTLSIMAHSVRWQKQRQLGDVVLPLPSLL